METAAVVAMDMLGRPYDRVRANCWQIAAEAQRRIFDRRLPAFRPRDAATRASRLAAAAAATEWACWRKTDAPAHGALVFLSRPGCAPDVHCGVALAFGPALRLLHSDAPHGVVLDEWSDLAARGWTDLTFFIPD